MNGLYCQSRDPKFRINFIRMTIFHTSLELELNVSQEAEMKDQKTDQRQFTDTLQLHLRT